MAVRITTAQARALGIARKADRGRKFGNRRTEYAGRVYDSKLEAQYAADLDLMKRAGDLRGVIPQVSLPVPGTRARLVVDFLLVLQDGRVKFQDVKAAGGATITRAWQLKRQIVESAFGITIEVIHPARRR
jgi:hypothetical protein